MRRSPAIEFPYLADPDYYRLGYQLSAQLLNREHAKDTAEGKDARRGGVRGWIRDLTEDQGPERPGRQEAFEIAEETLAAAREMSCWYRERHRAPWWQFWMGLSSKDERLMAFLEFTVEPCLELIIAGSVPEERWGQWVSIELLRKKAKDGHLSYRAVYSLACHEAEDEDENALALAYLRLALRLAPTDRCRALAKWAARDPSLLPLQEHPEFKLLLATFGVT